MPTCPSCAGHAAVTLNGHTYDPCLTCRGAGEVSESYAAELVAMFPRARLFLAGERAAVVVQLQMFARAASPAQAALPLTEVSA